MKFKRHFPPFSIILRLKLFSFLFTLFVLSSSVSKAINQDSGFVSFTDTLLLKHSVDSIGLIDTLSAIWSDTLPDTTHFKKENKRVLASILAFPFPFGMLGLHRVYLGTKPYIPFIYIGTIGGCFFILPFIDFCTIVFSDDETFRSFENNRKVFMWSH